MPCPFITRLPTSFVRNYGGSILKKYGESCPVISRAMSSLPAANRKWFLNLVKYKIGREKIFLFWIYAGSEATEGSGEAACPYKKASDAVATDIKGNGTPTATTGLKGSFPYETFFHEQILRKKNDHSYRIFKKVNRSATNFPSATEFSWGKKPITVWCSNDYLGMSCHPAVKEAVWWGCISD